jgi:hypothetical protein
MRNAKRQRVKSERTVEERRKNPRVQLLSDLYGCVVALDLPVLVRDASRGGFRIESECPFPVGSEHSFRFQTGGRPTTIVAVCRHIQRVNLSNQRRSNRAPRYAAGFEFMPQPAENLRRVLTLMAAATMAEAEAVVGL